MIASFRKICLGLGREEERERRAGGQILAHLGLFRAILSQTV